MYVLRHMQGCIPLGLLNAYNGFVVRIPSVVFWSGKEMFRF
jgi:hypothetical protein